uniref:Uncharacterized protein n=1 Tax=Anguilla anguilla TaxID=7936 RepID=A0A0E9UUP6_ANGAN
MTQIWVTLTERHPKQDKTERLAVRRP